MVNSHEPEWKTKNIYLISLLDLIETTPIPSEVANWIHKATCVYRCLNKLYPDYYPGLVEWARMKLKQIPESVRTWLRDATWTHSFSRANIPVEKSFLRPTVYILKLISYPPQTNLHCWDSTKLQLNWPRVCSSHSLRHLTQIRIMKSRHQILRAIGNTFKIVSR